MDTTFTAQRPVGAQRPATPMSPPGEPADVMAFRRRASRRHGRISLVTATIAAPAFFAVLIGSRALQGDSPGLGLVIASVVTTLAVIALFAFMARRGMTPPKYAYLGALEPASRAQAQRDLRDATPSSDPVLRLAETQRAVWANETGAVAAWALPLLAAIVALVVWAGWSDRTWLSHLPALCYLPYAAWRLALAARERPASKRYLASVDTALP